jgi:hypothetical protein
MPKSNYLRCSASGCVRDDVAIASGSDVTVDASCPMHRDHAEQFCSYYIGDRMEVRGKGLFHIGCWRPPTMQVAGRPYCATHGEAVKRGLERDPEAPDHYWFFCHCPGECRIDHSED